MNPGNILIQPTIFPGICFYLRPCERRSLFISIGYMPSTNDKNKYFNILDEIFEDRSYIEQLIRDNVEITLYGDDIPLISSLNRLNLSIGIHLFKHIPIYIDIHNPGITRKYAESISKIDEGTIINSLKEDVCLSRTIGHYNNMHREIGLKLSLTYNFIIDMLYSNNVEPIKTIRADPQDSITAEFSRGVFNMLDNEFDMYHNINVLNEAGNILFDTYHLSISRDGIISKGRLRIKSTYTRIGSRDRHGTMNTISTLNRYNEFVEIPQEWLYNNSL